MIRKIIKNREYFFWNEIKFINKKNISFPNDVLKAKLVMAPAAPALVENYDNQSYYESLRESDFSIIDSSFFALLCRTKFIKVYKYSGYRLIQDFIDYLNREKQTIFFIDPNENSTVLNRTFILNNTKIDEDNFHNYIAPFYDCHSKIYDAKLLEKLEFIKPRIIIIGIAGGKQELLGNYLKKNLTFTTTILCTGAALAFFTGEQAKINYKIDKYYLGWLFRILSNRKVFLPRYLRAFKFIPIFYRHKLS
ncbi:MAG: WecB/TagA/CpsF family glycosyltransferase [Elusimicrobiota bacterium]